MEKWWKEQVVYQIYPRSFQDSNGDGIGDLPGIISRLDEIKALGAGVLWLSPVYRSPDADNGYDISDYRDINPKFGTLEDMDRLFAEAKKRDLRIIMDLVINHTSDEHEWFQQSRDPNSPYRDYYIWRPAKPDGSPPNNWTSFFMGSVWTLDEKSGEYYLHLFDAKQPDLNYHNPKVIEEVKGIMRFWLDKGAAGFRCDVINAIYKTSLDDGQKRMAVQGLEHYKSQEGNHEILRELRRDVLDHYDCFTVGEAVMVDLEDARLLSEPERKELDMIFYFDHLEVDRRVARYMPKKFRAKKLLEVYTKWQQGLSWNAVYLENHDQPRIVSHYGNDRTYWALSAKLFATLQMTLRGTPFVYEGQEIGMTNFDFTGMEQLRDVESFNIDRLMKGMHIPAKIRWRWIRQASRDNARTPMQWSAQPGAGFTDGTPWIGINGNYRRINYLSQQNDKGSILTYYRKMIALRAGSDTLKYGGFEPLHGDNRVMAFARTLGTERYVTVLNISNKTARANFTGDVVIANTDITTYGGRLQPYEAVVLRQTVEVGV
ncbi:MAG TPA: alpha-glucosidase [Candidatus Limiplasma sp.]|nr:alpha-glucosidase [Candidatus Limiplasma sp.]HPS80786.1 alpha-glucosidase [Candidatus Limiplasma sp.]